MFQHCPGLSELVVTGNIPPDFRETVSRLRACERFMGGEDQGEKKPPLLDQITSDPVMRLACVLRTIRRRTSSTGPACCPGRSAKIPTHNRWLLTCYPAVELCSGGGTLVDLAECSLMPTSLMQATVVKHSKVPTHLCRHGGPNHRASRAEAKQKLPSGDFSRMPPSECG